MHKTLLRLALTEDLSQASVDKSCFAQERRRKWDGFASGEALFGLPVTAHPELQRTAEKLSMLGRLYGLYRSVIDTIRGYGDYLWSSVVSQVRHAVAGFGRCLSVVGMTLLLRTEVWSHHR